MWAPQSLTRYLIPVLLSVALGGCSSTDQGDAQPLSSKLETCAPDAAFDPAACNAARSVAGGDATRVAAYHQQAAPLAEAYAGCAGELSICRAVYSAALAAVCAETLSSDVCLRPEAVVKAAEQATLGSCLDDPLHCASVLVERCTGVLDAATCGQLAERLQPRFPVTSSACVGSTAICGHLRARAVSLECREALSARPASLDGAFCDLPYGTVAEAAAQSDPIAGCRLSDLDAFQCKDSIKRYCRENFNAPGLCSQYEVLIDASLGLALHCVEAPAFCAAVVGRVLSFGCHKTLGVALPDGTALCEYLFAQPPTLPQIPVTPPPRAPRTADEGASEHAWRAFCAEQPLLAELCGSTPRLEDLLSVGSWGSSR